TRDPLYGRCAARALFGIGQTYRNAVADYSAKPKTSSGSLRPRTGWRPSETSGRGQIRAKALENSIGRPSRLVRSSIREARLTAGPITVKSSRLAEPTLP